LAEKLDGAKLRDTVKRHEDVIVAQRLGYLLDSLRRQDLSKGFAGMAKSASTRPLDPAAPLAGATESRKWHVLINARLEPEA
jgi:predicted transcriptional regulator of viral defense system